MNGRVSEGARQAVFALRVLGPEGEIEIEAVIDTGFTGGLVLPPETINRLSLPRRGRRRAALADGRTVEVSVHRARVVWHDRQRGAQVLASDGGPLVGMALLRGSRLNVEVEPGGDVTIEEKSRDTGT